MSTAEIHIYGLAESRCDTMKKAGNWLRQQNIDFQLHDFKKEPPTEAQISAWVAQAGWEQLLNRRGTTWRKLDDAVKESIDEPSAIALMLENPSIIKRPVLSANQQLEVGFKEERYAELLG